MPFWDSFEKIIEDVNFYVPVFGIWFAYISFVVGIYSLKPANSDFSNFHFGWMLILGIISLFITYKIYQHIEDIHSRSPVGFKTKEEINNYMFNWISKDGQIVICTRDMTWGEEEKKIEAKLIEKANRKELTIFLPDNTQLTNKLKKAGAKICTYRELNYSPVARFTIVHYGTSSARVAVGRKLDDSKHIIEEFSYGNDPVFSVASDLIEILKRYNDNKERKS